MATEHRLYSQVVMIRQNGLDNKKEKDNTKKYKFQGQSTRSILWFNLNHEWLEENIYAGTKVLLKTSSN